jgi:fibronectin-binding autotransporter adhesin
MNLAARLLKSLRRNVRNRSSQSVNKKRRQLKLEMLEDRRLMAVLFTTADNTTKNWNTLEENGIWGVPGFSAVGQLWGQGSDAEIRGPATSVNFTLSIDSGNIDAKSLSNNMTASGSTLTVSATSTNQLVLSGPSVSVGSGVTTTISAPIAGSSGLTKSGTGTLTLSGTNVYSGVTAINAGTLSIAAETALGSNPSSFTANQLTLNGGTLATTGAMIIDDTGRGITLGSSSGTFNVSSGMTTIETGNTIGGTGDLVKTGNGTLLLKGTNNSYTGVTRVDAGTLIAASSSALGGTGASGNTIVASGARVQLIGGFTFSESLTIAGQGTGTGALMGTGSFDNTLNGLVTLSADSMVATSTDSKTSLNGSSGVAITNATGVNPVLTFAGGGTTEVNGAINLENGAVTWGGGGKLILAAANSYSGVTTIGSGRVEIRNASAFGSTGNGVNLTAGALELSNNIVVGAEALTLNGDGTGTPAGGSLRNLSGDNTWGGQITLGTGAPAQIRINSDSGTLTLDAPLGNSAIIDGGAGKSIVFGGAGSILVADPIAHGSGTLTKDGAGTLVLTGINTYTGKTTINAGTLQLGNGETTGALSTSSEIDLGGTAEGQTLRINRSNTVTQGTDFSGSAITGQGGFTQTGSGTTILSSANTYKGATNVSAGTLLINGNQSSATGAVTVASGATLGGTGTIGGAITIQNGGTLNPGLVGATGILNTANVTFISGSTFSVAVNGSTAGTDYDQLKVTGTVTLGNATLSTSGSIATGPGATQIVLIDNDGSSDAVSGTFNGLAEGATVTINGISFRISYVGGDGNDVTLNHLAQPVLDITSGNRAYNGSVYIATASITGNNAPTPTISYTYYNDAAATVPIDAPTNAGTYYVMASSAANAGNLAATSPLRTFQITRVALSITDPTITKVYDGTTNAGTVSVGTLSGFVSGESLTATAVAANYSSANVGTYNNIAVTYTLVDNQNGPGLAANYSLANGSATGTINRRAITITADAKTKTYGNADPTLTYSVTTGNVVSGDTLSGSLARAAGESVGTYAITQGGVTNAANGNYDISFVGANLTINRRAITITADAKTKTYGDADPTLTYIVTTGSVISGDTLSGSLDRTAGNNVGTYAITQGSVTNTANGNYDIAFVGANLSITAKTLTVSGATAPNRAYNGTTTATITGATLVGVESGDAVTVSGGGAFADKNVGSGKSVTANLVLGGGNAGNYLLTQPTGLTADITPKALTVSGAFAPSRFYNASTTVTVSGGTLVGVESGDSVTLGGSPTGTMASAGVGVGKPVTVTGYTISGATSNYSFAQPTDLTVDITPARLTVYADAKSKTVGDADPTLTFTTSALVGGETIATALTGSLSRASGEALGTYAINQGTVAAVNGNYAITFVGANFTINPAAAAGPTLTSVTLNNGVGFSNPNQRSMITSLTVAFSAPVTLAANAFTLENIGLFTASSSFIPQNQLVITPSSGSSSVFTITFDAGAVANGTTVNGVTKRAGGAAASTTGNSLADGNYRLAIDATKVSNGGGNLTGNNIFGAAAADNFFRLYGDSNGDGRVDSTDTTAIRAALRGAYNAAFDWDGNGSVTAGVDSTNFDSRINRRRRVGY